MKTEILVRNYDPYYKHVVTQFAELIAAHTSYTVQVIDHTNISEKDFRFSEDEILVSIDAYIAKKLKIPYYRISRVFDHNGNVLGRYEAGMIREKGNHVRVLDSDIVNGDTISYALNRFETNKYSVPLVVQRHQDLIDIEDIMKDNSIILFENQSLNDIGNVNSWYDPVTHQRSYMSSKEMFVKRTSLPEHMFDIIDQFKRDVTGYMSAGDFS